MQSLYDVWLPPILAFPAERLEFVVTVTSSRLDRGCDSTPAGNKTAEFCIRAHNHVKHNIRLKLSFDHLLDGKNE